MQINDLYLENSIDIDGKKYYNLENILKTTNIKVSIDENNKKVLINFKFKKWKIFKFFWNKITKVALKFKKGVYRWWFKLVLKIL